MSPLLQLISTFELLDLAIKSIALMLIAVLLATLLRRSSAAWRHLVWSLGVFSLFLLPAFSRALPVWQVSWLPQWTATPMLVTSMEQIESVRNDRATIFDNPPSSTIDEPSEVVTSSVDVTTSPRTNLEPKNASYAVVPWLLVVWTFGALLSLVPLAIGLWQLARLHRRSQVIQDSRWRMLLDESQKQMGVRRHVQLRQFHAALAPLTWGVIRPVLLVPAEATAWSDDRRRLVLLHELAHVRRWDWLTQLFAHLACTLYWFNPLVWLAARQMRLEREQACDDLVLRSGTRASDYAEELLALAAGLSHSQLSTLVAVPITRRGALEDRLRNILDGRRDRKGLTGVMVCLGLTVTVVATLPMALLRAASPEAAIAEIGEPEKESSSTKEPTITEKPVAEKPADVTKPQTNPLLGKEAIERIQKFPPAFSKAQEGIEVGISLAGNQKVFHEGQRVPLEIVIRNVSEKSLVVEHGLYPPETPPRVTGPDGTAISITPILLFGAIRKYQDVLKPNDVAVYRHMGLGLGERPNPPGTFWHPFLKNVVTGKYRLSQPVHVTVREETKDASSASFQAISGEVEFEIESADSTKTTAAETPVDKPSRNAAATMVTVEGKVVDDATGKPVDRFVVQGGKFDPADPKKVTWGVWQIGTRGRSDWFRVDIRGSEGSTARIVADGYLPQPVLASAPEGDAKDIRLTIRLKRGSLVRGVVLDHAGKPLKDASVYALGSTQLSVSGGQAYRTDGDKDPQATPVRTDDQGRFELPIGDAKTVVTSHPQFDVFPAPIPETGDVTIRLPEPARIEVNLDIDGADKDSYFYYELIVSQMPQFNGLLLRSERAVPITNPGKLVLAGVTPGKYQVCRRTSRMLELQMLEIKSGEVKTINYIRPSGARVRGKLTWPADAKLTSIHVTVVGDAVYAATSPGSDGTFLTERIPPGKHQLIAYAFQELTPEQMKRSGLIAPAFQSEMTIEVPVDGELIVPDLELKPRQPKR